MTDLTIYGAGVFGLSCAFAATLRGLKVRVIDPAGIGAGASGGLVGALSPHAPENWTEAKALQLRALLRAPAWWAEVEAASGRVSGYGRTGRIQPIDSPRGLELAHARATGAETLWAGEARWWVRPWQDGDPASPSGWIAEDTLAARIHPRLALQALAAAVTAAGGKIVTEGPPQGVVLEATGAKGLRALGVELGYDIGRGEKGQALSLAFDMRDRPQIYAPGLHIIPHCDGTVAIGSTSERDYDCATSTDAQLGALHEKAVAALPALANAALLERWAGERPRAVTRKVILDRHPTREGTYLANGGFKTGFAMAPAAAEAFVAHLLDGSTLPTDWALPQRKA